MPQSLGQRCPPTGDDGLTQHLATGIDALQVGVILLAMFAGGVCKGVIGVALPVVAISVMLLAIDARVAVAMMVIPILVTNVQLALRNGMSGLREPMARFWPLMTSCFATMFGVSLYAARLPSQVLLAALGAALIVFVMLNLLPLRPRVSEAREKPVGVAVGIVSGLMGGATSVYGPPITMYLLAAQVPKHKWSSAVGLTFGIGSLPLLAGFALNGMMTRDVALISAIACLPAFVGMWIGFRLQDRIQPEMFRKVLLAALLLIGLNLLRRGLF